MAEHGRAPRGSPGWAPAVGRRIAKNAAANAAFLAEKTAKTMQNDLRSSFLAPFRADRATAASDIIHHVADDDLRRVRQQRLVRCRSMCGPRFSPGRGFGQKSRRGSRDLAGTLPATTACARGGWSRKSARPKRPNAPPGNFPSLAVLGARRIVCGRLFGAQASRAKWSSPTTSGPGFRCPPARQTVPEVAQRKLSTCISYV